MLHTLGKLALEEPPYQYVRPLLLLAYLSLEGRQERRYLAQVFWPQSERPLNSLSALLFRLRRDVPGTVDADQTSVWSRVPCDAAAFLEAAQQGAFEQALDLYQGAFLENVAVDSPALETWLYDTRDLLAEQAYSAALQLAERSAVQGDVALATQRAEAALSLQDVGGLEPDALRRTYRLLHLGKSPQAHRLKLEAQAFDLDLSVDEETQPTQRRSQPVKSQHNLPERSRTLVGRQAELTELTSHLDKPQHRLLTLLGPGGVGKSRLALELAWTQLYPENQGQESRSQEPREGVYIVALEALNSPRLIPTRIADALSLTLQSKDDHLQHVIKSLGERRVLLVLDNFERLTEGVERVSDILTACPNVKIVVTSRVRLNLTDEWVYPLAGLAYPDQDRPPSEDVLNYDAPKLFYQLAKRTRLDFELSPEDAPHLQALCQRVSGFPLALELAATWLRSLPIPQIVREIEADLDFLTSLQRNAAERHQSMSAVLEQSWRNLSLSERAVLAQLSVFGGGFTREAASDVANASLLMLTRLIDKSLLCQEEGGRYSFHPLTRQFARGKLEPQTLQRTQGRHAEHFLSFAEAAELKLNGPEQARWLGRLEGDIDNLRAAIAFVLEQADVQKALRLTCALGRFWSVRGYFTEGQQWLSRALILAKNSETGKKIKALRLAGLLATRQGNYESARTHFEEGVALEKDIGDEAELARLYQGLGGLAYTQSDYVLARSHYRTSLRLHEKLNHQPEIARLLNSLGLTSYYLNDYTVTQQYFERSLSALRKLGKKNLIAQPLNDLGLLAYHRGNYEAAQGYYEESLLIRKELGDQPNIAYALANLGMVAYERADYALAQRYVKQSLTLRTELGDRWGSAISRVHLGEIVAKQNDPQLAQASYLESLRTLRELGNKAGVVYTLYALGKLANIQGEYRTAQRYLQETLELLNTPDLASKASDCLEETGHLARGLRNNEGATTLWAGAASIRKMTGFPLRKSEQPRYEANLAAARAELGELQFSAAWQKGETMPLTEAISYALAEVSAREPVE